MLEEFCKNNGEHLEDIRKDKKAIKKLKIACENIKRVLSNKEETLLYLNHFFNNKDIIQKISTTKFEFLYEDLFTKLEKPLNDAIIDAKITKNDIKEIILVGGSTRIPKIKIFLNKFFPGCKINDSINPDETVAYGATLMAAKIMLKKDNFVSKFNLMDITPFSLGTDIKNNSQNKDILKEGSLMSVIIKRGSKLPINNTEQYFTIVDNQKSVSVNIYEGEKKYIKYNHLLKEAKLDGLTEKPAGQVKINVNFYIDVNGILTVTANEEGKKENSIKIRIKNDGIGLNSEEIKQLQKKNEKYLKKSKINKDLDYNNLKETLKEYQDAYQEAQDEEEKINILMSINIFLEEFINKFDKTFDNETMIEKFYIYIKELFISYVKIFNFKKPIDKGDQINIINNIKEYINNFIILSSGYLTDLMDILKDLPKKLLYDVVIFIMEKFNEYGKNCLKERKQFCKYNSIIYFEKAITIILILFLLLLINKLLELSIRSILFRVSKVIIIIYYAISYFFFT